MAEFKDMEKLSWLNTDFVQSIVENDSDLTGKSIKVTNHTCVEASKSGENYSSTLFRLIVEYTTNEENMSEVQTQKKSYIVKYMQGNPSKIEQIMEVFSMFDKEVSMYNETLLLIEEALKSIDCRLKLAPKYVYSTSEPHQVLVIEDLQTSGFKMVNRLVGMDREHCEIVLTKLAKMHAASMHLNKKDFHYRRNLNEGGLNKNIPVDLQQFLTGRVTRAIQVMRELPELQKYVKFFEVFKENFIKDVIELLKPIPPDCYGFHVLNHGDFWINNMMFQYDDNNKPIDVKFLDFQISNYGLPALDLHYFLYTSTNDETRDRYQDDILTTYHSTLTKTLDDLKYEGFVPTFDNLKRDLFDGKDVAFVAVCIVSPVVKFEKSQDNISNKEYSHEMQESDMFTNPLYRQTLVKSLKYLEDIGYIKLE